MSRNNFVAKPKIRYNRIFSMFTVNKCNFRRDVDLFLIHSRSITFKTFNLRKRFFINFLQEFPTFFLWYYAHSLQYIQGICHPVAGAVWDRLSKFGCTVDP